MWFHWCANLITSQLILGQLLMLYLLFQGVQRTSALMAPIMLLSGHEGDIFCSKFSHDGQFIASSGFDRIISKFNSLVYLSWWLEAPFIPVRHAVSCTCTCIYNYSELWNVYGECENWFDMKGHGGAVMELQFSTDDKYVFLFVEIDCWCHLLKQFYGS